MANHIAASAKGCFQYVSFIQKIIDKENIEYFFENKDELFPDDLSNLYKRYLNRIFQDLEKEKDNKNDLFVNATEELLIKLISLRSGVEFYPNVKSRCFWKIRMEYTRLVLLFR